MNKTILDIKIHYEQLSKAEKKIADYLMKNPQTVPNLYVT